MQWCCHVVEYNYLRNTNTISKIKSFIYLSRNFKMHLKRIVWFVVDHDLRFMDFYLSNTKENLGVGLQQLSMQCFWHLLGIWIYWVENDIEVISNNIMIVNIARRSFLQHHLSFLGTQKVSQSWTHLINLKFSFSS